MKDGLVVVAGGGGFIGGHLVKHLLDEGFTNVRSVDIKPLRSSGTRSTPTASRTVHRRPQARSTNCHEAACPTAERTVYQLAADMGGMGFIELNKALCMLSVLTTTHALHGPRKSLRQVRASSSYSLLRVRLQRGQAEVNEDVIPLKEEDAYPAMRPRTATGGRSSSPSACAATSARTSASRPASPASTTSTAPTAPGTADARRPRGAHPQGPHRQAHRQPRDGNLGRRQADALVHVHRRLRQGHQHDHRLGRRPRADQPRAPTSSPRSTGSSTSSRTSPASRSTASTTSTPPRASTDATPTTPSSTSTSAGSPASSSATAWSAPTTGSNEQMLRPRPASAQLIVKAHRRGVGVGSIH